MPGPEPAPARAHERPPAIAELYRAFEGCAIPERLTYCTYCDDEAYERSLHAPLDQLPARLVDKYLADAIHHTGTAEDFLHFVPRIVELEHELDDGLSFFDLSFVDRLEAAGYRAWPEQLRVALCRALESAARARPRSDAWLDAIARVEGVDWGAIFPNLAGIDDPGTGQLEWLGCAIARRAVTSGPSAINAALEAWLDSEAGARAAEAIFARWVGGP